MQTKKILTGCITAIAVTVLGFSSAVAQDKSAGSGPNPFVDCGIGAALFPDTHWAAVTSNVIWDVGTTAVISATASPETCQGSSAKAAKFINDTYDSILEDTARGDGEHLVALLDIYECDAAVQSDIVDAVRDDIGASISADSYAELSQTEKAAAYFHVVDAEIRQNHVASCAV